MNLSAIRSEVWVAVLAGAGLLALIAWRRRLRWWPAGLLRLGLIALILFGIFPPRQQLPADTLLAPQVMVVDQSDSLSAETRLQAWQDASRWQAGAENRLLVAYGAGAEAVLPATLENAVRLQPRLDGRASDLPAALSLAQSLMGGVPGEVILLSDGLTVQAVQVEAAAVDLAANGHRLDAIPLTPRPTENDVAVGPLVAPPNLWSGTSFDLLASVYGYSANSEGAAPGGLVLSINGQPTNIPPEFAGGSAYRFHITDLPEGLVTLQVTAANPQSGEGQSAENADPFPDNNSAFATLQVFPPPRVLFVSGNPNDPTAARFAQLLTGNGIQVETTAPGMIPTNLDELGRFRVIILDDLLSSSLSREQLVALQVFVSRMAGGLVVLGGQKSFTLGGYQGTLIEPMLPVALEPPPRSERPPMVFQLVLDHSASMNTGLLRGVQPIALAREAAMRSIETLREGDYLGVLIFSDQVSWTVPLQQLSGAPAFRSALDAVSQVLASGGTHMYQAMDAALTALNELPAPPDAPANRHMLILSDGQSADGGPEAFRALAESAHAQGITISAIALGEDADVVLLEQIAQAGQGRFYSVANANDLPRILIAESQAARSENVQTGQTTLKPTESGHPLLTGIDPAQLPVLSGYNALTSKAEAGAEDVLVSTSFEDPILSVWQYGLGRVAAWTTDIGRGWSQAWPSEADEGTFWAQVVRYALVNPALGPAQVNVQVEPTQVSVDAAIFTPSGDPLNLAEVLFTYQDAAGDTHSYRLAQESPGIYKLAIPRPADGAYRAIISYAGEGGEKIEAPAPFAVNPPDEWLPPNAGAGEANLIKWTEAGGGELVVMEQLLAGPDNEAQADEVEQPLDNWWHRLLLAALILWPVEIAIRRQWLPWPS